MYFFIFLIIGIFFRILESIMRKYFNKYNKRVRENVKSKYGKDFRFPKNASDMTNEDKKRAYKIILTSWKTWLIIIVGFSFAILSEFLSLYINFLLGVIFLVLAFIILEFYPIMIISKKFKKISTGLLNRKQQRYYLNFYLTCYWYLVPLPFIFFMLAIYSI